MNTGTPGGGISPGAAAIAAGVLLLNLTTAGGIGFPGVALSLWLLAAVALAGVEESSRPAKATALPRPWTVPAAAVAAVLPAVLIPACFFTAYRPSLICRLKLAAAAEVGRESEAAAIEQLHQAAQADPWSARPHLQSAALHFARWQRDRRDADWTEFVRRSDEALALRPHSAATRAAVGCRYLQAYDRTSDPAQLAAAARLLARAVELYPADAMQRAQSAWVSSLAGDRQAAASAAEAALRLDQATPHEERKLAVRWLFADVLGEEAARERSDILPTENAELLMQRLRNLNQETPPGSGR